VNDLDIYLEGERIAALCVEHDLARGQLKNLVNYSKTRPKAAVSYWLKKQAGRSPPPIPLSVMTELESILSKCSTTLEFARIIAIAEDLHSYKMLERQGLSVLKDKRAEIDQTIRRYAATQRLGETYTDIKSDGGELVLVVSFEKRTVAPGRVAGEIRNRLYTEIPEVREARFKVWVRHEREGR